MITGEARHNLLANSIHIFLLSNLAFAQPLFDLLSRNAEFFLIRGSKPVDIILITLFLSFAISMPLILMEIFAMFSERFQQHMHSLFILGLIGLAIFPFAKKLEFIPGELMILISFATATISLIIYRRFTPFRDYFSLAILAIATLIFPGAFLFKSPVTDILFSTQKASEIDTKITKASTASTKPVIMIVFDEFPLTSLMDSRRLIDATRYPNFAALANDSYWFRNATTVSGNTQIAIPAMLSGRYPDIRRLPTLEEYPHNLFTLLNNSHNLIVTESATRMCPTDICTEIVPQPSFDYRMRTLISDLAIVYLHLELPQDLSHRLPPIAAAWSNFATSETNIKRSNRVDEELEILFDKFVSSVIPSERPGFYYLHIFLPHVPWSYLPSGKQYARTRKMEVDGWVKSSETWVDNEYLVNLGFQRHLLQVGFVDTLLGRLIERLKTVDMYEESVIVITADHGASFKPGNSRRGATDITYQDILAVPFFVKTPHQHTPVVDDKNIEIVDVLPTVADILDITVSWQVDGQSALDPELDRDKKSYRLVDDNGFHQISVELLMDSKYTTLKQKLENLGTAETPIILGGHKELIGQEISDLDWGLHGEISISLDLEYEFSSVDLGSRYVPAYISGGLQGNNIPSDISIAIEVNGVIHAVAQTFNDDFAFNRFACIVPEKAFLQGMNNVELYLIEERDEGKTWLSRMSKHRVFYTLNTDNEGGSLITRSDGFSYKLNSDVVGGGVRDIYIYKKRLMVEGWAADQKRHEEPLAVMLFSGGKFVSAVAAEVARPDVGEALGASDLKMVGFSIDVPLSMIKNYEHRRLRVFAITRHGEAGEFNLPKLKVE